MPGGIPLRARLTDQVTEAADAVLACHLERKLRRPELPAHEYPWIAKAHPTVPHACRRAMDFTRLRRAQQLADVALIHAAAGHHNHARTGALDQFGDQFD